MSDGRGLGSTYDEAERSPGLLLWQVTNRWQAAIRAALAPYELTHVQFVLLASLTWLGDDGPVPRPVTQRRLADHAATDPMMTSQVLRTLERRGLVVRRAHPDDGRAKAIIPTPAGARLARASVGAVERCDRNFFGVLGAGHDAFVASLERLTTSLRNPA